MWEALIALVSKLTENIGPITITDGVVLYTFGAISSTVVKLHFRKEWSKGMKGANGIWDSPEIMLSILLIIIDHIFMADAFLDKEMSLYAWLGIGCLFLYGFTGKWGLQWLTVWKGSSIMKVTEHTRETLKTTSEETPSGSGSDTAPS